MDVAPKPLEIVPRAVFEKRTFAGGGTTFDGAFGRAWSWIVGSELRGCLQVIHCTSLFNRVFHEIHHPFWGTPSFGNIQISLGGGNSKIFLEFSPRKLGKIFTPIWRSHIFSDGLVKNHQPGSYCCWCQGTTPQSTNMAGMAGPRIELMYVFYWKWGYIPASYVSLLEGTFFSKMMFLSLKTNIARWK